MYHKTLAMSKKFVSRFESTKNAKKSYRFIGIFCYPYLLRVLEDVRTLLVYPTS